MRSLSVIITVFALSAPGHLCARQTEPRSKPIDPNRTEPMAKRVTFKTSDGVEIAADYYAPQSGEKGQAPVAVLIHMYPATRSSWQPLVPELLDRGFAVLAY